MLGHGYDGEVVYAFVRLEAKNECVHNSLTALNFALHATMAQESICAQLETLFSSGERIAIWGGTGKAAAFMNSYGVDAERFPLVVDSDAAKAGTYVPGTGQLIRFRDWLKTDPPDVIIVPCQWRAADIVHEMDEYGVRCDRVLIPHQGRLVDFHSTEHPYRRRVEALAIEG
jgi:hypothetical protein